MNRLVTENVRDLTPERLPPSRREGPARVLFISQNLLGHVTQARNIRRYSEERDDIDAVHIDLVRPFWIKVANKSLPLVGHWDMRHYRSLILWRPIIRKWFSGPLDPSRFDVVHFLNPHYAWGLLELRRQGRVANTRVAVNLDCTAYLLHRELGWPEVLQRPVKRLEKRIVEESDLVVSMSQWSARSAVEDYGVPPEKIHLLPGCVVKSPGVAERGAPRVRGAGELPRMVFVGNDWVRKGGPPLVAIHQRHFADRAELHVLSRQAKPDPAARNVVWRGTVPHDVLQGEVLPSMDLMVLPTTNDMSPFAIIEAATAGLPVIATRLGGIPEMVVDGQTGLLVNRGDEAGLVRAVERLLCDPELRLRMGRAARKHMARHFDPDVNYNGFLDRLVALADQKLIDGI